MSRIRQRGRDFERSISPDYIEYLNRGYERWMKEAQEKFYIFTVNADEVDFLRENAKFEELISVIREHCP
jgi:deoxyadenosine/deoxycytidine kinase